MLEKYTPETFVENTLIDISTSCFLEIKFKQIIFLRLHTVLKMFCISLNKLHDLAIFGWNLLSGNEATLRKLAIPPQRQFLTPQTLYSTFEELYQYAHILKNIVPIYYNGLNWVNV